MPAHHIAIGPPVHEPERKAIDFIARKLPEGYYVYSNLELPRRSGIAQTFEHDVIVIAPHAVFTVEVKSWGGRIEGNRDLWTLEGGAIVNSPIPLISSKARALKGEIITKGPDLKRVWVQHLVFVSAADAKPRITEDFRPFVTTRDDIIQALTDPSWLPQNRTQHLSSGQMKRIATLLGDGRPPAPLRRLGKYDLVEQIPAEDRPYDLWIGQDDLKERRVLHIYELDHDGPKARAKLRSRALREATLHRSLYGGPDILRSFDYITDPASTLRMAIPFEDTTGLIPLDTWLLEYKPPRLSRFRVAERMARALAWVHSQGLVHRDISPEAFLLSPEAEPATLRLCAFELAREGTNLTATIAGTGSSLSRSRALAPELLRLGEAKAPADLFALGALLYLIFLGRPLFGNADDVLRHVGLDTAPLLEASLPGSLVSLMAQLLAPRPEDRPEGGAEALASALGQLQRSPESPLQRVQLKAGNILRESYELTKFLGRGATGEIWEAKQLYLDKSFALKIAKHEHVAVLQREAEALKSAKHPNLVHLNTLEPLPDGSMLVLELAPGVTGSDWAEVGDGLSPEQLLRVAEGLFGALDTLHQEGWLHRDVKPANLLITEPEGHPTLLDLGLATPLDVEGELIVGSVAYKDPLLVSEGQWTPANDIYSAWLTLFEVLTGLHPFGSSAPYADRPPELDPAQMPDAIPEAARAPLTSAFEAALSPHREGRPPSPPAALQSITAALAGPEAPAEPAPLKSAPPPPAPGLPSLLPLDADPSTPVAELPLSSRAQGALDRLGVTFVAELIPLEVEGLRRLKNVGAKTGKELGRLVLQARERFPGAPTPASSQPASAPPETLPFYPPLVGDPRPLEELGQVITPHLRAILLGRDVRSVGELAAYPAQAIPRIKGVGKGKIEALRAAMDTLSGAAPRAFTTLEALVGAIAEACTPTNFKYLSLAVGLETGIPKSPSELAALFGVSRQAVQQALTLRPLRADASPGAWLAEVTLAALPSHGFASAEEVARVLEARLPKASPLSHLGLARLGAWILSDAPNINSRQGVSLIHAPPWEPGQVKELGAALLSTLSIPGEEPPSPSPPPMAKDIEAHLWSLLSPEVEAALRERNVDAPGLLAALRRLHPEVERNGLGHLYIQPLPWARALGWLRPQLKDPVLTWADLKARALEAFGTLDLPSALNPDVSKALQGQGYRLEGKGDSQVIVDSERVEAARPKKAVELDVTIPRERLQPTPPSPSAAPTLEVPPALRGLVSAASQGGFRVVMLPPGDHHRVARDLTQRLTTALGPERVTFVDIDGLILDLLQAEGLWEDALFFDRRPNPTWGWATDTLTQGLDAALAKVGARGKVVILGEPSLLGPLDLMAWLTGFYDRARGGEFGLVILAAPGGLRDDRVRLNGQYHLPYTPDMAAFYLEEA